VSSLDRQVRLWPPVHRGRLGSLSLVTRVRAAQGWRGHGWFEVDGPVRGQPRRTDGRRPTRGPSL